MNEYHRDSGWTIWFSFLVGMILQIIPWPFQICFFLPFWTKLLLIYWITVLPHRVNINAAFILGLITDIIFGITIGIHALAFTILSYLALLKFHLFRNLTLWQQSLLVLMFSLITDIIIFWAQFLIMNVEFSSETFWNSVIDGIWWSWIFLTMQKIRRKLSMK
ncbi:rod shape-determining protein MreD [secondary endosymbiont of Heteropsylla cubana]|uniref:Rod shape-determining protein MreD n=1 Tax=secondary endosymbiont of Heteropsylla cubana TaxID=134287 RepID=J3YSW9_9ENTR|nr:rod shape-determining protein MreD [secondary endosymbiont of Heteropsylla cubana]AFP85423.1 rod shape-determining protein MreD [secondary endosymbiont of Heteropsylla cubana]